MRTSLSLSLAALALVAITASEADARPRPARRKSNFVANKGFGLGIMLGSPTGLSGKYFLGPSTAIDFGLGGIGCCRGRRGVTAHADFLWHPVSLISDKAVELPLYVGIGGRVYDYEWKHNDHYHDGGALGLRAPLGISFDLNRTPIDIFVELALVADFIYDDSDPNDNFDHDGVYVDIDGAFGVRYYFN